MLLIIFCQSFILSQQKSWRCIDKNFQEKLIGPYVDILFDVDPDIKDDLKDAYVVVTNFSLSAIDALRFGKPVFTDKRHIAATVAEINIEQILILN